MDYSLLIAVVLGIVVLLFLILRLKLPAFLAMLMVCILIGIASGMSVERVFDSIKEGVGGTLGFVATVVGLGALFGALLQHSGGAQHLAMYLIRNAGQERAPWVLVLVGFIVAVPVFFDVAFIILVPVIYALQQQTKRSLLLYAIPLLAGLAVTHSFIPPTPGPIAVADILKADLGWVIVFGFLVGLPAAVVAGPVFAVFLSKSIKVGLPVDHNPTDESPPKDSPLPWSIIGIILVPIVLIVGNTVVKNVLITTASVPEGVVYFVEVTGHPFSALIIANLLAWYFLGVRRGVPLEALLTVSTKALYPAGVIILLTGAGGAFKQVLIDTGAGEMMANTLHASALPPVLLGFLLAAIVRILQGSSTVAMITAAGIMAPMLAGEVSAVHKAIMVIAIAGGATTFSHVNDSGFWLVKQYLGLSEKQTFASWSVMTTLIAGVALLMSMLLWYLF